MIPLLDLEGPICIDQGRRRRRRSRVLASGHYVLGEEVARFEEEFAAIVTRSMRSPSTPVRAPASFVACGRCRSGRRSHHGSLTFVATTAAICYAGARPFSWMSNRDAHHGSVQARSGDHARKTKAIVPVHLYGQMADMDAIRAIADKYNLPVIEDACQAHGAEYKGRRAGSIGLSGCFSFYPGKNLGACGEGGIIVTNDDEQAKTMRMLRDWGQEKRYHHVMKGSTTGWTRSRVQSFASSSGIWRTGPRHAVRAARYSALLAGSRSVERTVASDRRHVYHVYAVSCRDRDQLQQSLLAPKGIQYRPALPHPGSSSKSACGSRLQDWRFPGLRGRRLEVLSFRSIRS
jgi:dTDP-4-amino-4,6-dideoxygalactose transaminase